MLQTCILIHPFNTYFSQLSKPLHSFDNANDYVFDVKWSPIHPAVFASVDAMGRIDIWNINTDTEVYALFSLSFDNAPKPSFTLSFFLLPNMPPRIKFENIPAPPFTPSFQLIFAPSEKTGRGWGQLY